MLAEDEAVLCPPADARPESAQGVEMSADGHENANQEWEQRFLDLVVTWKRERGHHSSSAKLAEHPAYQQMIAMGPEVVPLLLRELAGDPDHWFRALHALTGTDPVPPESRGKLREMADAWLRWGRAQGYHW
jgi:hypothetical protein